MLDDCTAAFENKVAMLDDCVAAFENKIDMFDCMLAVLALITPLPLITIETLSTLTPPKTVLFDVGSI